MKKIVYITCTLVMSSIALVHVFQFPANLNSFIVNDNGIGNNYGSDNERRRHFPKQVSVIDDKQRKRQLPPGVSADTAAKKTKFLKYGTTSGWSNQLQSLEHAHWVSSRDQPNAGAATNHGALCHGASNVLWTKS